jgi:GTP cyclohydrolase I
MLPDMQNSKDIRGIPVNKVGIKNLRYPISVLDKKNSFQHTIASINMYVDLPHYFKGTHMSRFLEVLNEYRQEISIVKFPDILKKIRRVLNASSAAVDIEFPYFIEKTAPVSGKKSLMEYICYYKGTIKEPLPLYSASDDNSESCKATGIRAEKTDFVYGMEGKDKFNHVKDIKKNKQVKEMKEEEKNASTVRIGVRVPISTLCPCSKEISDYGAHNQRGVVSASIEFNKLIWFEDIIADIESCASSPVYSLLKRSDEKYITEHAYKNPRFVEDVARCVANIFSKNKQITWFMVEVENFESIHNHNAYAMIEK